MASTKASRVLSTPQRHIRQDPPTIVAPPCSVFLQLLPDRDNDVSLRKLLRKYSDPEKQVRLYRILSNVHFAHQLHVGKSSRVSRARSWFKKRGRWRKRVNAVEKQLEALLKEFQRGIYPVLRASRSLPNGYSGEIEDIFKAFGQLQAAIRASAILSNQFTTRGHQAQPYLKEGLAALHRLKITEADAKDFLTLIGVKPDPFV